MSKFVLLITASIVILTSPIQAALILLGPPEPNPSATSLLDLAPADQWQLTFRASVLTVGSPLGRGAEPFAVNPISSVADGGPGDAGFPAFEMTHWRDARALSRALEFGPARGGGLSFDAVFADAQRDPQSTEIPLAPEPSTLYAGLLLLLPFAAHVLRALVFLRGKASEVTAADKR